MAWSDDSSPNPPGAAASAGAASRVHPSPSRRLAARFAAWVAVATVGWSVVLADKAAGAASGGEPGAADKAAGSGTAAAELFSGTNLVRIAIELDRQAVRTLSDQGADQAERPRVMGIVEEGGRRYTNVSVQLKGNTSFRSIQDLPSFTLKFDRHVRGQRFYGLEKISLNNSVQDPTVLHEALGRELFAAAGVPVPRAGHAVVTLNGRRLGVYALVEGYDRRFLARHFARTDGALYEGGILRDIQARPRLASGQEPGLEGAEEEEAGGDGVEGGAVAGPGVAGLERLIAASADPDPDRRFERLSAALDLDRFLSMAALETILCHSDSYSMNRNNYRVYVDPSTGRCVFMPHGMDRMLGAHRSPLDLSIVPPCLGLVSRALFSTEPGRRLYLERLGQLTTNLFRPEVWAERVRQWDSLILPEKLVSQGERDARSRGGRFWGGTRRNPRGDANEVILRMRERAEDLAMQLQTVAPRLMRPSAPRFDAGGVAMLEDWHLRPRGASFGPGPVMRVVRDGAQLRLELEGGGLPFEASVRHRLTLEAGRYRLRGWPARAALRPLAGGEAGGGGGSGPAKEAGEKAGADRANGPEAGLDAGLDLAAHVVRGSSDRFQLMRFPLVNVEEPVGYVFSVMDRMAPEEVEIVVSVRSPGVPVAVRVDGLRLERMDRWDRGEGRGPAAGPGQPGNGDESLRTPSARRVR